MLLTALELSVRHALDTTSLLREACAPAQVIDSRETEPDPAAMEETLFSTGQSTAAQQEDQELEDEGERVYEADESEDLPVYMNPEELKEQRKRAAEERLRAQQMYGELQSVLAMRRK
jgi:hypothetical protein